MKLHLKLHHFDPSKPKKITCNASTCGPGTVMEQRVYAAESDQELWTPICFASRYLTPHELKYGVNVLKMFAVAWSLEWFGYYVYGCPVGTLLDHCALANLRRSPSWKNKMSSS